MTTVPSTARAAFFQTVVAPAAPVAQPPAARAVEARTERPQAQQGSVAPDRPLRPGSIIDIKV